MTSTALWKSKSARRPDSCMQRQRPTDRWLLLPEQRLNTVGLGGATAVAWCGGSSSLVVRWRGGSGSRVVSHVQHFCCMKCPNFVGVRSSNDCRVETAFAVGFQPTAELQQLTSAYLSLLVLLCPCMFVRLWWSRANFRPTHPYMLLRARTCGHTHMYIIKTNSLTTYLSLIHI